MTEPTLYRCARCSNSVLVSVKARVVCVKCARAMAPRRGADASFENLKKEGIAMLDGLNDDLDLTLYGG